MPSNQVASPIRMDSASRVQPAEPSLIHCCPICTTRHRVSAARAQMAYGRQICCSPDCEGTRRRLARGDVGRTSHR